MEPSFRWVWSPLSFHSAWTTYSVRLNLQLRPKSLTLFVLNGALQLPRWQQMQMKSIAPHSQPDEKVIAVTMEAHSPAEIASRCSWSLLGCGGFGSALSPWSLLPLELIAHLLRFASLIVYLSQKLIDLFDGFVVSCRSLNYASYCFEFILNFERN